jgi:hypothetical protein
MIPSPWKSSLVSRSSARFEPARLRAGRCRPRLEALEDRTLLAITLAGGAHLGRAWAASPGPGGRVAGITPASKKSAGGAKAQPSGGVVWSQLSPFG